MQSKDAIITYRISQKNKDKAVKFANKKDISVAQLARDALLDVINKEQKDSK